MKSYACLFTSALFFLVTQTMCGQTPPSSSTQGNPPAPPERTDTGVYSSTDIFTPKVDEKKDSESAASSFADAFLHNTRHRIGLSLGAFESYTPKAVVSSTGPIDMTVTSFIPQIYANVQKKRFDFHLKYGVVFNRYNKDLSQLNLTAQTGTANFSYSVSHHKTTFQVTDFLSSLYNDPTSYLAGAATPIYSLNATPELYLDHQRQTQNSAIVTLGENITKKFSVSISAGDQAFRYTGFPTTQLTYVTAGTNYQINKWMAFNISYTHYLNHISSNFADINIEHLQIVGFSFKLKNGWRISSSAGIDSTKAGTRLTTASGQAAISKSSRRTSMGLSYSRGYSTFLGYSAVPAGAKVYYGDTASLFLVQQLLPRVSLSVSSSYFGGSVPGTSSFTRTVLGTGGLEFALRNNLIVSSSYFVVSQSLGSTTLPVASFHRTTASVGIKYYLPSVAVAR